MRSRPNSAKPGRTPASQLFLGRKVARRSPDSDTPWILRALERFRQQELARWSGEVQADRFIDRMEAWAVEEVDEG